jgi:cellulose synthase/poly-beta-1,6-N-acetylglucosamine synthase-like glycosyltransferase
MFRKRTAQERFWEILPGLNFWVVFFGAIFLSIFQPVWASIFIICFDLYWVLKAINVATHLVASYNKFKIYVSIDWLDYAHRLGSLTMLQAYLNDQAAKAPKKTEARFYKNESSLIAKLLTQKKTGFNFLDYYQLILIPFTDESFEVLDSTFSALADCDYPKDKMMVILASEGRYGQAAQEVADKIKNKYQPVFYQFFTTTHPEGLEQEIKGKSANATYALKSVLPELERLGIKIPQVLVSNFDSDTIVHQQYFARVIYAFLTSDKPYQKSYQPIAIYNNNIWDTPALIRVVSVSNSFWQFTESSRPNRLRTFSSHTMTLRALVDVGFWKKDIVNEDGYIFWQCYLHYDGDYEVVPLFIPISLDTCLANSVWQTLVNQYKQKRRWAYNVEYYPHLMPQLLKSKAPLWDRLYKMYQYIEGNFNWAAASILISMLGWLPILLGGNAFRDSVIGYNLPTVTKTLMTIATFFLIFSVYINLILLPPRPKNYSVWRSLMMYLQWFLVPLTSVIFGSLPAVEAQTRLMFGRYLEFWVTPKARKGENTAMTMKEMQTLPLHK